MCCVVNQQPVSEYNRRVWFNCVVVMEIKYVSSLNFGYCLRALRYMLDTFAACIKVYCIASFVREHIHNRPQIENQQVFANIWYPNAILAACPWWRAQSLTHLVRVVIFHLTTTITRARKQRSGQLYFTALARLRFIWNLRSNWLRFRLVSFWAKFDDDNQA